MARPEKSGCDYFSHDNNMRNHRKVKAIRTKFDIRGYAIYNMLLEYMTSAIRNRFELTDTEIELLAGDFGVGSEELTAVINYCVRLDLFVNSEGWISSNGLDERLKPVYDKRSRASSNSGKQYRDNGKFVDNNNKSSVVSVAETPQSKVKESKGKESISIKGGKFSDFKLEFTDTLKQSCLEILSRSKFGTKDIVTADHVENFFGIFCKTYEKSTEYYKDEEAVWLHFKRWLPKQKINGKETGNNRGNSAGTVYGNEKGKGAHATGL